MFVGNIFTITFITANDPLKQCMEAEWPIEYLQTGQSRCKNDIDKTAFKCAPVTSATM